MVGVDLADLHEGAEPVAVGTDGSLVGLLVEVAEVLFLRDCARL